MTLGCVNNFACTQCCWASPGFGSIRLVNTGALSTSG